jgi:hypothetical protein
MHYYLSKEIVLKREYFEQIYHVWEGYLRKLPVERRNFPSVPWYLRKRISLFYPRVPQTAKFIRNISPLPLYVR